MERLIPVWAKLVTFAGTKNVMTKPSLAKYVNNLDVNFLLFIRDDQS